MICVECQNTVECTHYKYKGDYIKLAVCPQCSQIVDQYIEYDNVLLFLDIILMKPQAYRHLCFNAVEAEMTLVKGMKKGDDVSSVNWRDKLHMFGSLGRFILIMILFEVYLSWAQEEKNTNPSIISQFILSQQTYIQYLLFIIRSMLSHFVFNILLQFIFFKILGWNKLKNPNINDRFQVIYFQVVLLICVLVSNSIKVLPVLMLIWPYDQTLQWQNVVVAISLFNNIEALKNISHIGYAKSILIFIICGLIERLITIGLFSLIVSRFTTYEFYEIFQNTYQEIVTGFLNVNL